MKQFHEALLDREAYPHRPASVRMVQTHISWVYITDTFVYKVKKPVDFGFLDFTTLAKRKYFCEQEVALNRRLSPHIYIEVVPVTERGGNYSFGADGTIVDYAVKMKYIPEETSLRLFLDQKGTVESIVDRVADTIARFHETAESSSAIDKFGAIETIRHNTDENFDQTRAYIGKSITADQWNIIKDYTDRYYAEKTEVFKKRVESKRIRDCHGDLHLDHVYVTEPITIVDCIEFNERFRYSDTAADVAFLAMDLDFNGYADLSGRLVEAYIDCSGDEDLRRLLNFYKVYRAYVRGKVISFRLDDPNISAEEKKQAAASAGSYFALARKYVDAEAC